MSLHKERDPSQLSALLHAEKLSSLSRAVAYMVSSHGADLLSENDVRLLLQLLETRILPEIGAMRAEKAVEVRQAVAKMVLHAVILDQDHSLKQWAVSSLREWYRGSVDWKEGFESVLRDMVSRWSTHFPSIDHGRYGAQ